MTLEIDEIKRIKLEPGEKLAVEVSRDVSAAALERIIEQMSEIFPGAIFVHTDEIGLVAIDAREATQSPPKARKVSE